MRIWFLALVVCSRGLYAQPAPEIVPPVPEPNAIGPTYDVPAYAMPRFPEETESVSLFSRLLYWKVTEGSAENWAQVITPPGSSFGSATLIDAPFEWRAGFRIGAAYQPAPDFDATLYYTHFGTQAVNAAAGEVYSAYLGNFFAGNPDGADFGPHYRQANVDWDFQFHTIDLEFGRRFAVSPALYLRPFVGLKSAVIRQTIDTQWRNPIDSSSQTYLFSTAVEQVRQDFWSLGPSLGAEAVIPLSSSPKYALSFFASPSGALMYGEWRFSDRFQTDGPTSTAIPNPTAIAINSSPIHGAATMARGVLGFEWTQQFARLNTRVRLGYEAQIWLNQMQYYSYNMGRLNNLTSLHGGTLDFTLEF